MLDVTNNALVLVDMREEFGATCEAATCQQIKPQSFVQAPQRVGLSIGISGQPDIRHAAAVDQFL